VLPVSGVDEHRARLSTSVISGRMSGLTVSLPLGSARTAVGEALSEVVADDVARLVCRVFIVSHVLAVTVVCYITNANSARKPQLSDVQIQWRTKGRGLVGVTTPHWQPQFFSSAAVTTTLCK